MGEQNHIWGQIVPRGYRPRGNQQEQVNAASPESHLLNALVKGYQSWRHGVGGGRISLRTKSRTIVHALAALLLFATRWACRSADS
jgi:hypothetical protein